MNTFIVAVIFLSVLFGAASIVCDAIEKGDCYGSN